MTINITKLSRIAFAIGALTFGGAANAAVSWSLTSANCTAGDCTNNTSTGAYGNSMTFKNSTGVGASAVLTAWSNTASSNTVLAAAEANLYDPSGIGVRNSNGTAETTSPQHAIDNDTNIDSVLLNFGGTAVTLNSLKLGWTDTVGTNDSDITVLAYTGAGAPTLAGKTYGGATGLIASGWTKVADLSNVGTASAASFNAASTYSSSYWLISAFNSSFGSTLDNTKDYFKLQLVGGNLPSGGGGGGNGVPVPATALLMLGGLPILASMSRRRKSKAILAA